MEEVREDAAAHREELNAIYEELEAQDPEAAETFEKQVEALDEKVEDALEKGAFSVSVPTQSVEPISVNKVSEVKIENTKCHTRKKWRYLS